MHSPVLMWLFYIIRGRAVRVGNFLLGTAISLNACRQEPIKLIGSCCRHFFFLSDPVKEPLISNLKSQVVQLGCVGRGGGGGGEIRCIMGDVLVANIL